MTKPDSLQWRYQMTPRRGATILGGSISYCYDTASRLSSVSDGTNTAVYGYLANSALIEQTAFWDGPALRMTTTKHMDQRIVGLAEFDQAPERRLELTARRDFFKAPIQDLFFAGVVEISFHGKLISHDEEGN